jgi:hypothetical protein
VPLRDFSDVTPGAEALGFAAFEAMVKAESYFSSHFDPIYVTENLKTLAEIGGTDVGSFIISAAPIRAREEPSQRIVPAFLFDCIAVFDFEEGPSKYLATNTWNAFYRMCASNRLTVGGRIVADAYSFFWSGLTLPGSGGVRLAVYRATCNTEINAQTGAFL